MTTVSTPPSCCSCHTSSQSSNYRSADIDKVMGALAKAQGAYKTLTPNQEGHFGTFANLQSILAAVKDALAANGLSFYQYIELLDEGSGAALLRTIIGHESGQYIGSCARVITGKTDRKTGYTYEIHKRFHALMILGIAPSENDPAAYDDNGTSQEEEQLIDTLRKPKKEKINTDEVLTKDRYNDLLIELEGYDELAKSIMDRYGVTSIADLPNEKYHEMLGQIRRVKRTAEEYEKRKKRNE